MKWGWLAASCVVFGSQGVVLGAFGWGWCLDFLGAPRDSRTWGRPEDKVMVVVAARDLPAGATVLEEDLYAVQIAPRYLPPGVFLSPDDVTEATVLADVLSNEFVRAERVSCRTAACVALAAARSCEGDRVGCEELPRLIADASMGIEPHIALRLSRVVESLARGPEAEVRALRARLVEAGAATPTSPLPTDDEGRRAEGVARQQLADACREAQRLWAGHPAAPTLALDPPADGPESPTGACRGARTAAPGELGDDLVRLLGR